LKSALKVERAILLTSGTQPSNSLVPILAATRGHVNLNCYTGPLGPLLYQPRGGFVETPLDGRLVFWRFGRDWEGCCGFWVRPLTSFRSRSYERSPDVWEIVPRDCWWGVRRGVWGR
jgi:hypothetical protein